MPKVTFFSGSSATAGRQIIDECLLRIDGPRQSFIYVAPTARRARSFENRLLREKRGGFFRPHLLTFHSLMEMLYRRMGGTGVPISASVKAMLIEEIISGTQLRLDYFARSDRPFPGLVHRLASSRTLSSLTISNASQTTSSTPPRAGAASFSRSTAAISNASSSTS